MYALKRSQSGFNHIKRSEPLELTSVLSDDLTVLTLTTVGTEPHSHITDEQPKNRPVPQMIRRGSSNG